jgi:hypothetical protein
MNRRSCSTSRLPSAARLLVLASIACALLLGVFATGTTGAILNDGPAAQAASLLTQGDSARRDAMASSSQAPLTYRFQKWVSPNAFYAGVADTYISLYEPTQNYGGLGTMRLHSGSGGRERLLVKFDISSIPSSMYVVQAELYLYAWYRTQPYNLTLYAYRVRRHWNELEASWQQATTGDFWASAGCTDPVFDYDPTAVATTSISYTESWYAWDLTEMARGWVSDPVSNEGVLIVGEGLSNQYQFRTSEIPAADLRPYLVVTVSTEGPTSTPTSSPTPTLTPEHTYTPTNTPTPTASPTSAESPTPTSTPTETLTPTTTPTPVLTPLPKVFQQGLYPSESYIGVADTFLSLYRPDTPWGSDDGLRISGREDGSERILVRFDLDGHIPFYADIHSAKLALFAWSRRSLYGLRISVYDVLRSWDASEATWNEAYALTAWGIPGCEQVGGDREGDPAASRFAYFTSYFYEWDITALVQQWVADAGTNHGVVLIGHPVDQDMRFRSSEWRVLEQRPRLSVVYTAVYTAP